MDDEHPTKRIKHDHSPSLEELVQQPQLQDEDQSLEEDHCSICLNAKVDTAVIPTCSHEFCFECILIWTEQSRKCPLCSQLIGDYLIHRIRSNYDYQKHFLPPLRTSPLPSAPAQTQGGRDRPRNLPRRDRRWGQRQRQTPSEADQLERAIARRRWIYNHRLYAKHVASNTITRYRPFPTPVQFASSPDLISRMTAFLRRELRVWPELDIEFLTTFTISLMKSINIRSESAIKLLAEFLDMNTPYVEGGRHENAEHFAHEIYCYLRSPFRDLNVYDSVVQYDIPGDLAPPVEPDRSNRWRERRASRSWSPNSSPGRSSSSRSRSPLPSINPDNSHGFDEIYVASVTLSGNMGPRSADRKGQVSRRDGPEDLNIPSRSSPRSDRASDSTDDSAEGSNARTQAEDNSGVSQRVKDKGKARERSVDQFDLGHGDELSHLVSQGSHSRAMDVSGEPVLKTRLTPKGKAVDDANIIISAAATENLIGDPIDSCSRAAASSGLSREPLVVAARLTREENKPPRHSTLRQSVEAHLSKPGSVATKTTQVRDRTAQPVVVPSREQLRRGDEQPARGIPLKLSLTQRSKPSLLERLSSPLPASDSNYRLRSTSLSLRSCSEGLRHEAGPGLTCQFDDENADTDKYGLSIPDVMSEIPQPETTRIQQLHEASERRSSAHKLSSTPGISSLFPPNDPASRLIDESVSLGAHDRDTPLVDNHSFLPPLSPSLSSRPTHYHSRRQEERREGGGSLGPRDGAVSGTRFQRVVPRQAPASRSRVAGEKAPPPQTTSDSSELPCREGDHNAPGPSPLHSDTSLQAGRQTAPVHAGSHNVGSTAIIEGGAGRAAGVVGRGHVPLEGTPGGNIVHGGDGDGNGDGDADTMLREQILKASIVRRRI